MIAKKNLSTLYVIIQYQMLCDSNLDLNFQCSSKAKHLESAFDEAITLKYSLDVVDIDEFSSDSDVSSDQTIIEEIFDKKQVATYFVNLYKQNPCDFFDTKISKM